MVGVVMFFGLDLLVDHARVVSFWTSGRSSLATIYRIINQSRPSNCRISPTIRPWGSKTFVWVMILSPILAMASSESWLAAACHKFMIWVLDASAQF